MPPYAVMTPFRNRNLYEGELDHQVYRYQMGYNLPMTTFPTRLKKYELMVDRRDQCWRNMTTHQQISTLEECCVAQNLNLLLTLPYHFLKIRLDEQFYESECHLMVLDTPEEAMMFKLKWPGKIIGANK